MDPLKHLTPQELKQKTFSLLQEFKNFALRGNMIDLAVGVIDRAAFGKIVGSLVDNIFMPLIGLILPGNGYEAWYIQIGQSRFSTASFSATWSISWSVRRRYSCSPSSSWAWVTRAERASGRRAAADQGAGTADRDS